MTSEKNYDELLYSVLCGEGNIMGFFDRIFDFLYRRTDYFRIKKGDSSMGLAPGEAEKIVRSVFCKYMEQAVADYRDDIGADSVPLEYVAEEVVTTAEPNSSEDLSETSGAVSSEEVKTDSDSTPEADQSQAKIVWMDPDSYNGAEFEDYCWAQTVKDVDVRIKVPKHVITGKQVRVLITQSTISVEALFDNEWNLLKQGDMSWKINVEESTWTLVPGEHIHIYLQKMQERWWDSLFSAEPKIDLKGIDPTIAYEDLDEESQAKISELMYNERQKHLGKPTIQQNKLQNILKEAWNTEGSPFKGQPFDPSIVNIQNADNLL